MSESNTSLRQESFYIPSNKKDSRKKLVRQDRWAVDPEQCYITNDDFTFEVNNLSTFGCACLVKKEHFFIVNNLLNQPDPILFKLIYSNIETQEVSLKLVRLEGADEHACLAGFEVVNMPINIERCKAISDSNAIILMQKKYVEQSNKIPMAFKAAALELKEWFSNLQNQIIEIEKKAPVDDAKANEEFRLTVAETISDYLGEFLPKVYTQLPNTMSNLTKEETELCTLFIRQQLAPFVYGAPFASRAYFKPRGYAGDYEMMNHLYRNELVGKTLFDQCMHKYFIDEPAGQAVKNRGHYLFSKIKQLVEATPATKKLKILSIASGPAMELQLFIKNCPEFYGRSIEITCIDQDEESLKHAQKQLISLEHQRKTGYKFFFSNAAIKNIIVHGLPDQDYDLIYSAGLFDYFTDPVAQMAAKQIFTGLKPDGQLIIGNFSKDNPCVPFMEYVLDWILIYRSKNDLSKLFNEVGSSVNVEQEPLGVNLFAVIKK